MFVVESFKIKNYNYNLLKIVSIMTLIKMIGSI